MTRLSMWQREKRSFKQNPIRSTTIWFVVLTWAACFIWMVAATAAGMASTLFGVGTPNFWQTMAARALGAYPLVILALWILLRTPIWLPLLLKRRVERENAALQEVRRREATRMDDAANSGSFDTSDPEKR